MFLVYVEDPGEYSKFLFHLEKTIDPDCSIGTNNEENWWTKENGHQQELQTGVRKKYETGSYWNGKGKPNSSDKKEKEEDIF